MEVPKPEAALKELLRGRSEYDSDVPTTLAACSLERTSLPASLADAPWVEDLLDEEARRYLQCPEQMLNPDHECPEDFSPYWDPSLRRSPKLYKKFIQMLHQAGYLTYTLHPKGYCGVFFVKKSDGQKIRMILDSRGTNARFRPPLGWTFSHPTALHGSSSRFLTTCRQAPTLTASTWSSFVSASP